MPRIQKEEEWEAEITEQMPDRHIAWRRTTGAPNAGSVRFEQAAPDETRGGGPKT